MSFDAALSVIITYLVHSTLLFGATWALTGTLLRRNAAACEVLWRVALVGGVITTGFHASAQFPLTSDPAWQFPAIIELTVPSKLTQGAPSSQVGSNFEILDPIRWREFVVVGFTLLSALALISFAASWLGVRRTLRRRETVEDDHLLDLLRDLERRAGLRHRLALTRSRAIASPIAIGGRLFGLGRGEIVIPAGIEEQLSREALRGVLAHEVAHHRWHDPLWRLIDRAIVTIGITQPLHRLAARHLAELAEFRCDAWAVYATGAPESFAEGLATVAAWMGGRGANNRQCQVPTILTAMAARPSTLARRIDQVLDRPRPDRSRLRPIAVIASIALVPAISPALPFFQTSTATAISASRVPSKSDGDMATILDWIGRELDAIEHELARLPVHPGASRLHLLRGNLETKRNELATRRDAIVRLVNSPTASSETHESQDPDDLDAHGPDALPVR